MPNSSDADYVLALKGNHETAFEEISEYLDDLASEKQKPRESKAAPLPEDAQKLQSHSETEKDHGRSTTWRYYQSDQLEWFAEKGEWE